VDDSTLVAARSSPQEHSRAGQIELLGQLISANQNKIRQLSGPPKQLEEQEQRLETSMQSRAQQLAVRESEFREASGRRRDARRKLEEANERLAEVHVLLERFNLLGEHYQSDVERLEGIKEAGTLFIPLRRRLPALRC